MKPIPAIIEPAQVDIDLLEQQVKVALAEERHAETSAARWEQQAADARETARARRVEIGNMLRKVRAAWPERGPKAKGWGEFLERVGIDQSTAWRYMNPEQPRPSADGEISCTPHETDPDDDAPVRVHGQIVEPPPFRQLTEDDLMQAIGRLDPEARKRIVRAARVNPKGGSGDEDRGTWCTSKAWAQAVGAWDLDPFSNPRSHIASVRRCMLEDGGDGFGGVAPGSHPGLYLVGTGALRSRPAMSFDSAPVSGTADELTRVWIQPPYELVAAAIAHYGHTRFCALLRWSPDVKAWFPELWRRTAVVCHPFGERMDFEPPPGIDKSGDMPFPHALYYAHEADVTAEVRARCIVWRIDHDLDDARTPLAAQLHIVH